MSPSKSALSNKEATVTTKTNSISKNDLIVWERNGSKWGICSNNKHWIRLELDKCCNND